MPISKVIHYPDTNSVEATWVEVVTPEQIIPASIDPSNGAVIPEQTIPAVTVQTKCHSYADVQMDMLRADLGDDSPAYADLIATVEENIKPPVPPTSEEINASISTQIAGLEQATLMPRATREFMLTFFAATAASQGVDPMTSPAYVKVKALDDQIAALRRAMV